ncbi:MAG: DUF4080 domain-containing protein [Desulfobulbaceae bacterium]|nr:DUF4080 domain-containing protein [Desulfobulbaceae bacterium]
MKIVAVGINARYTHSCLACFYLRQEVEHHLPDAAVAIRQFTINDPPYEIVQQLADEPADYLFFSAVIWNSELLEHLIDDLLVVSNGPRIVVGGPQAEVIGIRCADRDRVCIFSGAIEAAGSDFYRDLRQKEVRGHYRAPSFHGAGRVLTSPYRPEDFAGPLANRAVYYESSRGCPFSCSYCLSSAEHGLYHKDLDQVRTELAAILVHRPKTLRFVDRTFNDRPQRALAIWRFLAEQDGPTLFHFELAPDRFTEEMFAFLETVEAGRFQFEIGLQSTNPSTLAAIRRPVDPETAAETIRRLRRLETIHLHVDLILGLPFESAATFARSINDAFAMEPHYIQMGLLKILPGTEMAATAPVHHYRFSPRPPYPVFANRWLDETALRALYRRGECLERFVNNRYFVALWRYLVAGGEDMAMFFRDLAKLFVRRVFSGAGTTQETLSILLFEHLYGRGDADLCRELLTYDWLRCGHRFLPDHLQQDVTLEELRDEMYRRLPAAIDGLFDRRGRSRFIKKQIFYRFSPQLLEQTGCSDPPDGALLCFLTQREERVFGLQKTVLLTISD